MRIPGQPYALKRHRTRVVQAKGKTFATQYDPKENREWKNLAAMAFAEAMAGLDLPLGPIALWVGAHFICPKSRHRKREPRAAELHIKKPDLDNVVKAVKDAGKGVLWHDDSQVCFLLAWKITQPQAVAPYTVVSVGQIQDLWANTAFSVVPVT